MIKYNIYRIILGQMDIQILRVLRCHTRSTYEAGHLNIHIDIYMPLGTKQKIQINTKES